MEHYQEFEVYRKLIGGYQFSTSTEEELELYAKLISPILIELVDDTYKKLFYDKNWRFRMVGYWFSGITMQNHYSDIIGKALVRYPNHATAQVFALVRFNKRNSIDYLQRYLDTHCFTEEWLLQRENLLWDVGYLGSVSLNWALAGLSYLDIVNKTQYAEKYLIPDNAIKKYYISTLKRREKERNLKAINDTSYTHYELRWDIQKSKIEIESAINFANKYFPEYEQ